uniref:Uncharacterized protein n=1 Tax=Plectus sambesii TaxID=2011161 RepID=A0A914VUT4_9BILA
MKQKKRPDAPVQELIVTDLGNEYNSCNSSSGISESINLDQISAEKLSHQPSELETALLQTIKKMNGTFTKLSSEFQKPATNLTTFYEKHFKQEQLIDSILPLYVKMYRVANRPSWAEVFDDDQRGAVGTPGELRAAKELQSLEERWDQLMVQIDEAMTAMWQMHEKNYVDFLDIGAINLVDCERMVNVSLRDLSNSKYGRHTLFVLLRENEFQAKLVNIVIVCKGSKEGGAKWKQITGVTFPVLADETGDFVRSLHFGVSVWNMCKTKKFNGRGRKRAAGITEFKAFVDDKMHDFYQLGGDVIIDSKGKLLYVFKSKNSDDRPPVDELLETIPKADIDPFHVGRQKTLEVVVEKQGARQQQQRSPTSSSGLCGSCNVM